MRYFSLTFTSIDDFKEKWPQVSNCLKQFFDAGDPVQVDFRDPVRTLLDNAKLHAILEPIRKEGVFDIRREGYKTRVYCNEIDSDAFKTHMIDYFCNDCEQSGVDLAQYAKMRVEYNPFTGERNQIRPSTTKWSKKIVGLFCQSMRALAVESLNPIVFDKKAQEFYEEYAGQYE